MLINITKSVPLKELCKITAGVYTKEHAGQIKFTFSHEAMIGFATELLWMYDDMDDKQRSITETHPLKTPAPSQAIGFYLTPDSPVFMVKANSLTEQKAESCLYENWKEIDIRTETGNLYYNVKDPTVEDIENITLEPYELSRRNIADIKVFDDEGKDITKGCGGVTLEINREGIKDFATMLLVWADNYKEGNAYELPHIGKLNQGYNLGIILTHDSVPCKFQAQDLGMANDYDSRF